MAIKLQIKHGDLQKLLDQPDVREARREKGVLSFIDGDVIGTGAAKDSLLVGNGTGIMVVGAAICAVGDANARQKIKAVKDLYAAAHAGTIVYTTGLATTIDNMIDAKLVDYDTTAVTATKYYSKDQLDAKLSFFIADKVPEIKQKVSDLLDATAADVKTWIGTQYYDRSAVDTALNNKLNLDALNPYIKTADVNAALALKANISALDNFYTKNEVYSKLETYTKAEINSGITSNVETRLSIVAFDQYKNDAIDSFAAKTHSHDYAASSHSHASTESWLSTLLANKVDAVAGKGLSTNDFTNEQAAAISKHEIDLYGPVGHVQSPGNIKGVLPTLAAWNLILFDETNPLDLGALPAIFGSSLRPGGSHRERIEELESKIGTLESSLATLQSLVDTMKAKLDTL